MIPSLTVRPLEARDFDAWLPLWHDRNAFYRNPLSATPVQVPGTGETRGGGVMLGVTSTTHGHCYNPGGGAP